ncbi:hypothetical protein P43SY_009802 [Pythium insidiosum]|uniref:Uncharacterized protein n=1 Tax=Pythium insidiosum TaxID=114742 RepID=A0AAD5L777_PYTIN|nr:hypothetical protein P43SY_009802 [Pythium insidiosum]
MRTVGNAHESRIAAASYNEELDLVATGDDAGNVHVYDFQKLYLLFSCCGHAAEILLLSSAAILLSSDADGQELSGSSSAGAAPAVRRAASETAALRQLPRRGHDDDAQSDGGGHYVAVDDSPRAIAQAAARVAEFVNRQREQAGGALVSRRQHASARFRNQRMVSSASQHTNGSAGSTTSNDHCSDHDDDDDDDDDDDGDDGDGGQGNGGSRGGTSDRHRSHRSGGPLRARHTWWLYMQLRRFVSHLLPGLKRDSNTFLCAAMISNMTLIVVLFVVRLVINEGLLDSLLTLDAWVIGKCFDYRFEADAGRRANGPHSERRARAHCDRDSPPRQAPR